MRRRGSGLTKQNAGRGPIGAALAKLKRLFGGKRGGPGEDPYAYVMAPKKPKPPYLRAAVAEREPD